MQDTFIFRKYLAFMQTLTNMLIDQRLTDRVFTKELLARLVPGTPQKRYGLVNRALARGELLQLQRGIYLLAPRLQGKPVHPFVVAQALRPGSYISFESALSFHGWIPESVPMTLSAVPGRRKYETRHPDLGSWRFYPLATRTGFFLHGVERHLFNLRPALVATPLRALLDIVCLHKIEPTKMPLLTASLRINDGLLQQFEPAIWQGMEPIYQHQRMRDCIHALNPRTDP